jgi:uncharacterized membrane protein
MVTSEVDSDFVSQLYDAKLLFAAAIVCIVYLVVELTVGGPAQVLLGLFVLFVAPGYGVASLLFGRGSRFPWPVHIAFIVCLGVVTEVMVGLLYFVGAHGTLTLNLPVGWLGYSLCIAASLVQWRRGKLHPLSPLWGRVRRRFALPGFTAGQRVAAFALLAAILVTLGAIGYLSTVHPEVQPLLSIAVLGPDGTTNTLPTVVSANQTAAVTVEVRNDGTAQTLNLTVLSELTSSSGTPGSIIPWLMPLRLGSAIQSSTAISLAAGASNPITVTFAFATPGEYSVTFTLQAPGQTPPVDAVLSETVR